MSKILYRYINGEHNFTHNGFKIINPEEIAIISDNGDGFIRTAPMVVSKVKDNDIFDLPEGFELKEEKIYKGISSGIYKKVFRIVKAEKEPEESQVTWDDALTDAIEATEGNIQHYTKMMNYLNENFTIQRRKI